MSVCVVCACLVHVKWYTACCQIPPTFYHYNLCGDTFYTFWVHYNTLCPLFLKGRQVNIRQKHQRLSDLWIFLNFVYTYTATSCHTQTGVLFFRGLPAGFPVLLSISWTFGMDFGLFRQFCVVLVCCVYCCLEVVGTEYTQHPLGPLGVCSLYSKQSLDSSDSFVLCVLCSLLFVSCSSFELAP